MDLCLRSSESDDNGSVEEEWLVMAKMERITGAAGGREERKDRSVATSAADLCVLRAVCCTCVYVPVVPAALFSCCVLDK